jgi:hypothetical protein
VVIGSGTRQPAPLTALRSSSAAQPTSTGALLSLPSGATGSATVVKCRRSLSPDTCSPTLVCDVLNRALT